MQSNRAQLTLFLLIVTAIVFALSGYIFHRGIYSSTKSFQTKVLLSVFLFGSVAMQFLAQVLYRRGILPPRSAGLHALQWVSYSILGLLASLLLYFILRDLILLAAWALSYVPALSEKLNPERRAFLSDSSRALVATAAGVSLGAGVFEMIQGPRVVQVRVPIRDLPPELDGLKIAQISDLHVGPTIARNYVEKVVQRTLGLQADLIALTGDMADGDVQQLKSDFEPFKKLQARLGIYFCTGNHDYYSGADEWAEFWKSMGVVPLQNEHRLLNHRGASFVVAGVHDSSATRFYPDRVSDPKKALGENGRAGIFKLLLAHQPKSCFDAEKAGFDLQLSGHTHGGQFFPFSLLVSFAQPYLKGLHRHSEKLWVYVSRGTGYWGPPTRFTVPAEITEITLTRG